MIGGLLARVAGPRVLMGVVIAAGLAIAFLGWRLDAAREDEAAARERAREYQQAHRSALDALQQLRAEAERNARLLAETQARAQERGQDLRGLRDALTDARRTADAAYRECLDVPLPEPVRSSLQQYRGGAGAAGDAPDAAGVDDG